MQTKPPDRTWKPTRAQREQVEMMVAVGASVTDIAIALQVTRPTLRKHCKIELASGRMKKRGELIVMLWESARGGNVSAQKKLVDMTDVAGADASFNAQAEEPAPRPARLGKKQEAALAASRAGQGTDWGDDLNEALPH